MHITRSDENCGTMVAFTDIQARRRIYVFGLDLKISNPRLHQTIVLNVNSNEADPFFKPLFDELTSNDRNIRRVLPQGSTVIVQSDEINTIITFDFEGYEMTVFNMDPLDNAMMNFAAQAARAAQAGEYSITHAHMLY